jgi:hypothetical protein
VARAHALSHALLPSAGQELHSDSVTVQACGLRNRVTLNAVESPEPNKYTQSPSEYREHYESHSYTWLFSQAVSWQCQGPLLCYSLCVRQLVHLPCTASSNTAVRRTGKLHNAQYKCMRVAVGLS